MNRILLDTNVLVVSWRNPNVRSAEPNNASKCINSVTYIEFLQGAIRDKEQKRKDFWRATNTFVWMRQSAIRRIDLIEKYSHSEGLRLADALIAATCLILDLQLLTFNRRHFQKIANLKLI